jgi:hypothetical protein
LGKDYVFKWIIEIAIGIAELEEIGIYHADLQLRNTIRVTRGVWNTFKIIDFDKAFKVVQTHDKDIAFESTKDLIDFWLRSNFDGEDVGTPYDEISHFNSS